MHPIIKEIFHGLTFSTEEYDLLYNKLNRMLIQKGEFLLNVHDEINDLYYVHQGCLRNYFIDKEGREHTLQFAVQGWWISDYIALYGKNKISSVSYIECLKNATIYKISKTDFDEVCIEFPIIGQFHIRKMELAFASFQNRILENLTLSASQRYINFITSYPSISNEVKNYHIASYLGITTESLSRIRKEISSS